MLKYTIWSIRIFSQERRGAGRLFRKLSEGRAVENVHTERNIVDYSYNTIIATHSQDWCTENQTHETKWNFV